MAHNEPRRYAYLTFFFQIMKMLRTHEAEYLKDCSTDNSSGVNMLYGYNVKLLGVILKK